MRHRKAKFRLNRFTSWRKATLRSMARNLLLHQSIRTTLDKAKAARPLAEELIGLGKANSLNAKRAAFRILGEHRLVKLLFEEISPRFNNRESGYTRIISLWPRRGDNAKLAILELTEIKKKEKKPRRKEKQAQESQPAQASPKEERPAPEKKTTAATQVQEKPPLTKKPPKNFLKGIKNIFKKERDSL